MQHIPFHIKDINGYVFFSDKTTGKSGKPVKIHTSLFVDFFCAVDPTTHDGQTIIRDIENLRVLAKPNTIQSIPLLQGNASTAKHNEQMQKVRNTNNIMAGKQECSLATKHIRVFYRIHQYAGDICPTVYISDLQIIYRGQDQVAGLYESKTSGSVTKLIKIDRANLEGRLVVISGASDSASGAMESAKKAFGKGVALFFNPKYVASDLNTTRSARLTEKTRKVIDELAAVVAENQKRSVAWYVEHEGAAVLSHALKKVTGSLEKHSFRFLNARSDLSSLMQSLSQRKAKLDGEFIAYESDKAALFTLVEQKQALLRQLDILPSATGYEKITRRYLMRNIENLADHSGAKSVLSAADSMRSSKATFLSVLSSVRGHFK